MQSVSSNAVARALEELGDLVDKKNLIYKTTDDPLLVGDNSTVDINGLIYGVPYLLINTHCYNVNIQYFVIFSGTVRVYNIFVSSPLDITYVNNTTVRVSSTGRNARASVWRIGNMQAV